MLYYLRPASKADRLLQGSQTLHLLKSLVPILLVHGYHRSQESESLQIVVSKYIML